jgi:CheY-like chemotaxis protein
VTVQEKLVEQEAGETVAADASSPNGGGILIVDDEESICRLFLMILKTAIPDAKFEMADNGAEALSRFHDNRPGVVIMDLHMPVMDGLAAFLEMQAACRENGWEMPAVIFCTGFAPPDTVRKIIADDSRHALLLKPVSGDTLVEVVKSRLAS